MNRKEKYQKYKNDIGPYIAEGLIREVYEGDGFTATCFVNSAYAIFVHGVIDKTNHLSIGINLRRSEFALFMELPTLGNFISGYEALEKAGEKRGFTPNPELMAKFRDLKRKLDAENKVDVDLELEQRLVAEAKRKRWLRRLL